MTSPLGFKARVGSALFELCGGVRDIRSLRFTSGATPLPVYNASIAASRLPHMLEATRLPNGTDLLTGERYGPKVHTINNKDPYAGVSIEEGNGRYPVIFEPLQNVQTSRSMFKVTSFIDFTPYLEYFHSFEQHLGRLQSKHRFVGGGCGNE